MMPLSSHNMPFWLDRSNWIVGVLSLKYVIRYNPDEDISFSVFFSLRFVLPNINYETFYFSPPSFQQKENAHDKRGNGWNYYFNKGSFPYRVKLVDYGIWASFGLILPKCVLNRK